MTIIQPNKNNNDKLNLVIGFLSAGLIGAFITGLVLYTSTVNTKHEISLKEESIEKLKLANAETQSALYEILDAKNLERLAEEKGLVKDPAPRYLETKQSQWVVASQY